MLGEEWDITPVALVKAAAAVLPRQQRASPIQRGIKMKQTQSDKQGWL